MCPFDQVGVEAVRRDNICKTQCSFALNDASASTDGVLTAPPPPVPPRAPLPPRPPVVSRPASRLPIPPSPPRPPLRHAQSKILYFIIKITFTFCDVNRASDNGFLKKCMHYLMPFLLYFFYNIMI